MPSLTAIPGLPSEAIEQLTSCGIESAEMLAAVPPAEIHRVLELTAWQKGKLSRAPTLDMVHHWAELARCLPALSGAGGIAEEDLPEAIVLSSPALPAGRGYVPPAQRARLAAAGPPVPAAAPVPYPEGIREGIVIPAALPAPRAAGGGETVPLRVDPAASGFNSFKDYQAGITRVTPLNRYSLDEPGERPPLERINAKEELSRSIRRGVVHPNPGLLVFGAVVSLLWRAAVLAAILCAPWLFFMVPRPSDYAPQIYLAAGVLAVLGICQLVVLSRARCRICSCHLFFSRNCVKNPRAHSLPGLGKTACLALHLLLFQWFRCMYCGTAIKLWASKGER